MPQSKQPWPPCLSHGAAGIGNETLWVGQDSGYDIPVTQLPTGATVGLDGSDPKPGSPAAGASEPVLPTREAASARRAVRLASAAGEGATAGVVAAGEPSVVSAAALAKPRGRAASAEAEAEAVATAVAEADARAAKAAKGRARAKARAAKLAATQATAPAVGPAAKPAAEAGQAAAAGTMAAAAAPLPAAQAAATAAAAAAAATERAGVPKAARALASAAAKAGPKDRAAARALLVQESSTLSDEHLDQFRQVHSSCASLPSSRCTRLG